MEEDLLIIANGQLITCDARNTAGRYSLLIRNGTIAEITPSAETLFASAPSATVIDVADRLVVPGFVNAHIHSESILLREATDGKPFRGWSHDPHLRHLSQAFLDPAAEASRNDVYRAAYLLHLRAGTTCVGEFPPPLDGDGLRRVLDTVTSTGVRCVVSLQHWDQIDMYRGLADRQPRALISLGNASDLTMYKVDAIVRAGTDLSLPLVVHMGELPEEVEYVRKNFGRELLELLKEHHALQEDSPLLHLNHVSPADLARASETGATVTLMVRSAAEKRAGCPIVRQLHPRRLTVSLGTDWGEVDMLAEMTYLAHLALALQDFPQLSALQLLRMATINGARTLGLADTIGSIERGKRADLVFFSLPDIPPMTHQSQSSAEGLARFLLRHRGGHQIQDVMIDGRFVMRERVPTVIDEGEVIRRYRAAHNSLLKSLPPGLSRNSVEQKQKMPPDLADKVIPLAEGIQDRVFGDAEETESLTNEIPFPPQEQKSTARKVRTERGTDRSGGLLPELPKDVRRVFGEDDEG